MKVTTGDVVVAVIAGMLLLGSLATLAIAEPAPTTVTWDGADPTLPTRLYVSRSDTPRVWTPIDLGVVPSRRVVILNNPLLPAQQIGLWCLKVASFDGPTESTHSNEVCAEFGRLDPNRHIFLFML